MCSLLTGLLVAPVLLLAVEADSVLLIPPFLPTNAASVLLLPESPVLQAEDFLTPTLSLSLPLHG